MILLCFCIEMKPLVCVFVMSGLDSRYKELLEFHWELRLSEFTVSLSCTR